MAERRGGYGRKTGQVLDVKCCFRPTCNGVVVRGGVGALFHSYGLAAHDVDAAWLHGRGEDGGALQGVGSGLATSEGGAWGSHCLNGIGFLLGNVGKGEVVEDGSVLVYGGRFLHADAEFAVLAHIADE